MLFPIVLFTIICGGMIWLGLRDSSQIGYRRGSGKRAPTKVA